MNHALMVCAAGLLVCTVSSSAAAPLLSNLQVEYRSGQIFITWDEPADWTGTVTVHSHSQPITEANLAQATALVEGLGAGSAYDWFLHPEAFGRRMQPDKETGAMPEVPHKGFRIHPGGERLNPDSGLFVHTVTEKDPTSCYYAVTAAGADGVQDLGIVAGVNSLTEPVQQQPAPIEPIWQLDDAPPQLPIATNVPFHLRLHGAGGRGGQTYLAFGDASMGWREGLPMVFGVAIGADAVVVSPTDRTWIGRILEGGTSWQTIMPTVGTWWYGYNSNINDGAKMAEGVPTNFTERQLLFIIDWVKRSYGTDPNRTYVYGSSMGGGGGMSFALRHPEIFAGIRCNVPIVTYLDSDEGKAEYRFEALFGGMDQDCNEGIPCRERLDAREFIRKTDADLPLVVMTAGRADPTSPWWPNPELFRVMQERRQPLLAAWNNETHGAVDPNSPEDLRAYNALTPFHSLALNKSYVVFTNASHNSDPGTGPKAEGDLIGHINRGLSCDEPVDEADRYEVVIKADPQIAPLPITVDLTPRRRQAFKPAPGAQVIATNTDAAGNELQRQTVTVDAQGLITFAGFQITSADGNTLRLGVGD